MSAATPAGSASTLPVPAAADRRVVGEVSGRVRRAFEARAGRRVPAPRVEERGPGVVLSGHADSYYAQQVAQHVVDVVTGRWVLANRIDVAGGRRGRGG